jgi:hypothetical protein
MKNLIFMSVLLFSTLTYAQIELYNSESSRPHAIDEMSDILESFVEKYPEKNIVFYVHGRKKDVNVELKRMSNLEATYNVKVVMLHWDSWSTLTTRPVKNAEIASESLSDAFLEIQRFKEDHQAFFKNHSINLICHSMGNLVLQFFTQKYLDRNFGNQDFPLFENFIGSSPDVHLRDHNEWLGRFHLAKQKNITMNNLDQVLLLSYGLDLKDKRPLDYRLGLGLSHFPGNKELAETIKKNLVKDVIYLDFSGVLGAEHGYFLSNSPLMLNIYYKLLNAQSFELNTSEQDLLNVRIVREKNLIHLMKK